MCSPVIYWLFGQSEYPLAIGICGPLSLAEIAARASVPYFFAKFSPRSESGERFESGNYPTITDFVPVCLAAARSGNSRVGFLCFFPFSLCAKFGVQRAGLGGLTAAH